MELASLLLSNEGCGEKNHKSNGDGGETSLQLELKLSWPNDEIEAEHGDKTSSNKTWEKAGDYDGSRPSSSSSSLYSRNVAVEEASWRCSNVDNEGKRKRMNKKLRLSKEQACFLEESFKENATLNPKQKHAIAKRLGLCPRQVEVWFQNKRSRIKLKQKEVDCQYLRQHYESLAEENGRLQKEIQELRALQSPSQYFHMNARAAPLRMCPSCECVASKHKRESFVASATN